MAQIPVRKCGFCNKAVAALFCEGCHQTLCVDCKQNVHDKVPIFKDHAVVNINKEGNHVFKSIPVCEKHKSKFRYYCSKCDCLTCEECMTSTHNEHRTDKIKNVADARRERVKQILDKLKTKVEANENKVKTIDTEHSSQISLQCDSYVIKVEETAKELHDIIDRNKVIFMTKASDFKEIETQDSNKRRSFFHRLYEESTDRMLKYKNLMHESHDVLFFVEWKNLQTDIEVINEKTEQPLNSPKQMESFDKNSFTRTVIEEINDQVISRSDVLDTTFEDECLDDCVICMDTITEPMRLNCGHVFCVDCIEESLKIKPVCPTCGTVHGILTGNQPEGTMDIRTSMIYLSGYRNCETIVIEYDIHSGIQEKDHPQPGRRFDGITRTAYLPNNERGRQILKMLQVAFKRKLVFTIGCSRTTGKKGVVTWNDIHHKTNPNPNTKFGYPDETYFSRVIDELAVKGVTEKDI
ncbi:uncharacterized protein LOC134692736 isoform X2 [Mytilus trossulus]|uniref:uncharacterized protein LOC134692736 isoform X2 n=1 Tax=Mytilus trossulus TaxID=6551 RepID=UPI003005AF1F